MSAGRGAVAMDESELARFLGENLKVQIATIGRDGAPHLTTLFYALDEAGRITFWTYGSSQKIRNLRRDARISALVEDGVEYHELRGVSITGRALLVEDPDRIREIGRAVVRRMAGGADLGELGDDIVEQQVRKRVAVVIEAASVASWDHAKMNSFPGRSG